MTRIFPALAAVAAIASAATTVADAQRVSRITAGKLAQICGNPRGTTLCDAYIAGVADALAGAKHFETQASGNDGGATCIPQSVTAATLRSTVHDYFGAHADTRDQPAAVPVVDALHAAYPCGKQP